MARSISSDLRAYLPQWTAKVGNDLGGRDPLALSPVAHLFTERLLGGIITTTNRARYYSLYCWILWHIAETESPEDVAEFMDAFQRREAAFAIGTVLDEETNMSPIGVAAVKRKLDECEDSIELDFQVLPSSQYGGFQANYMGCMYQLGLWHRPTAIREEITDGIALALAHAVDVTLSKTPFARKRLWGRPSVDLEEMRASAKELSLAAITRKLGTRERQLVTALLFGWDEGARSVGPTAERPETLAWILWVVAEHERAGFACPVFRLEHHLLYAPLYSGLILDHESGDSAPCTPPNRLERVAGAWLHFAVHGYLTVALEQIMSAVLMVLEDEDDGVDQLDLVSQLLGRGFHTRMTEATGKKCTRPRQLMLAMGARQAEVPGARLEPRPLSHTLAEPSLADHQNEDAAEELANGLLLLCALYRRWRWAPSEPATSWLRLAAGGDLWSGSVLPALDVWFDVSLRWEDAILTFLQRFVVAQHDLVMYHKGRLESCWLHADGERLYFDQDLVPQFRASRFPQAVNMLSDLGLLESSGGDGDEDEGVLRITADGHRVLQRVMEQGA